MSCNDGSVEVAVACLDEGEVALVGRGAVEGGLEVPEEEVAHQGPVVQRPVQQKPGQRRIVVALDCRRTTQPSASCGAR